MRVVGVRDETQTAASNVLLLIASTVTRRASSYTEQRGELSGGALVRWQSARCERRAQRRARWRSHQDMRGAVCAPSAPSACPIDDRGYNINKSELHGHCERLFIFGVLEYEYTTGRHDDSAIHKQRHSNVDPIYAAELHSHCERYLGH